MSPQLARPGRITRGRRRPMPGAKQTSRQGHEIDASDPYRTWQYRLLDHVVGADEDRLRDGQPERLGGLEIDHQLEFGRLFNRHVGRLGAIQDFGDLQGSMLAETAIVFSVSDQTTHLAPTEPLGASRWQTVAHGHFHYLGAPREQRHVVRYDK